MQSNPRPIAWRSRGLTVRDSDRIWGGGDFGGVVVGAGGEGGNGVVGIEDVDLSVDEGVVVGGEVSRGDGAGDFARGGDFDALGADDGAHDAAGDDDFGALEDAGEAGGGLDEDGAASDDAGEDRVAADDDVFEKEVFMAGGAAGVDGANGDARRFGTMRAVNGAGGGGLTDFGALDDLIPVHEGKAEGAFTEDGHGGT